MPHIIRKPGILGGTTLAVFMTLVHTVNDAMTAILGALLPTLSIVFALARLARIAAEKGQDERAGRLWGAVEAEEEGGALGAWYDQRERFAPAILAHAGPEFERARAEGRLLALETAVHEALNDA
jgi:hypothetical protein